MGGLIYTLLFIYSTKTRLPSGGKKEKVEEILCQHINILADGLHLSNTYKYPEATKKLTEFNRDISTVFVRCDLLRVYV